MKAIRRFTVRTVLPPALEPLGDLAMNLRWSWHPETRDLFAAIDPGIWRAVDFDPVRMLGAVTTERLAALAEDHGFLRQLTEAADDLRDYLTGPRWYQSVPEAPRGIAYFSPEYGITAVMPQYSGGLGILAGDHLKAASDLGVPIIGVGLLYRRGYFRQSLAADGWQVEDYPLVDPDNLPLTLLRKPDGTPLHITIGLPNMRALAAQVWRAQVGRVPLLLLDSDVEDNTNGGREVTDRLYGGSTEHRLHQEMLLGIGGVRAVRAFCQLTGTPEPEVFHTNEGHAGFLGLERIRELTEGDNGVRLEFDAALEAVRAGTVFTTHTPVPAGIDRFSRDLVARHFGDDNTTPGVPVDRVLSLGAETYPDGDPNCFNMAVMGLRLAQRANGVSQLHGEVSREMFSGLWPGFDAAEVPIGSVTNGVHAATWTDRSVRELLESEAGVERAHRLDENDVAVLAGRLSDKELWELRGTLRRKLVEEVRRRLRDSWLARGASQAELGWTDSALDPDVLTIGFARRVPSYKRLTLMLRDRDRLASMLLHAERPVQLVIAGKAHPADDGGKRLIKELVQFSDEAHVRHRIVFLPDYDIALAQRLMPGCDVWLNNPLRPLEACGTSGMKAVLNGCLNLSIRDGWWDEWYESAVGWEIPSAGGVEDTDRRDDLEAAALYELIERNVAPRFYDRDANGLPTGWVEMVRRTLTGLGPKVLASRMVRDYVREYYVPAATSARRIEDEDYQGARRLAEWKARVRAAWPAVRVHHVESVSRDADPARLGGRLTLNVLVTLGELTPEDVTVQVVYGRVDGHDDIAVSRVAELSPAGSDGQGRLRYAGEFELDVAGPFGYTVRVVPHHPLLSNPVELGLAALPDRETGPIDASLR